MPRWPRSARTSTAGTIVFGDADEDIHSVVEREVTGRLGDLGAKLHAGRSRNDLVVTDLRLWLLDAADADRWSYRRAGVRAGRARA